MSKVTKWRLKQLKIPSDQLKKVCDLVSREILDREVSTRKAFWIIKQKFF